jgi:hypothetical protein
MSERGVIPDLTNKPGDLDAAMAASLADSLSYIPSEAKSQLDCADPEFAITPSDMAPCDDHAHEGRLYG